MSNLTKSEKQALDELFGTLDTRENLLQKIKNVKKVVLYLYGYLFRVIGVYH